MHDTGEIKVYGNDIDKAIRLLQHFFNQSGLSKELRRRESFESKSHRRKRKIMECINRKRKEALKKEAREKVQVGRFV